MAQISIVLDTNVLLSGVAYPNSVPGKVIAAWKNGRIDVILSHYILDELQRVLPRLNHRLGWSPQDIQDFIDSLAFLADIVEPLSAKEQKLRDEADQPVLGTLLASKANYLVTGDKDLLTISNIYPILSPAQFWQLHGGG
jgi:putative PIN family toxin of toxin-antitoxin system